MTYDSFKLIHTRNVFDPDRRPVRTASTVSTASATRADYVALTGTMISGDKSFAFFSGSRSDFNKVLSVGDKIASSTLTQITPLNVVMEREGRRVTVAVGQTVPLDGKSAPGTAPASTVEVTATTIDRPPAGTDAANPSATGANPAPALTGASTPGSKPPTGSKEEIMRRMMEKRQQELK